jgi:hypothetical protein
MYDDAIIAVKTITNDNDINNYYNIYRTSQRHTDGEIEMEVVV